MAGAVAAALLFAFEDFYDVEGVAPDDVLNIRSAPEMKSAQIGTLPHDANNIEVIAANAQRSSQNTQYMS